MRFSFRKLFFIFCLALFGADGANVSVSAAPLPSETIVDLVKPGVVRVVLHVRGTATVPSVKVDVRRGLIAVDDSVPAQTIPVDEYLTGSGFVIHPDGYIATNAHVVSEETVKQILASESALSAFYGNALMLSEEEMDAFLNSEGAEAFGKRVIDVVIDRSTFDLVTERVVLDPRSSGEAIGRLFDEGFPADTVSINENFFDDDRDVAILRIAETNLPSLRLAETALLPVGKRLLTFGFPSTAELNGGNPLEPSFTQGVVSAIKSSSKKEFSLYQTDAKVSEGSSGGPIFNEQGEVVGMVTFQTDELTRESGDNFAFALPVSLVREAAAAANVPLSEEGYSTAFRAGALALEQKHCREASEFFTRARQTNEAFDVGRYLAPYENRCEKLVAAGESIDSFWDRFQNRASLYGEPFWYLAGLSLVVFASLGAMILWLIRQVRREEKEIHVLEGRVSRDERTLVAVSHRTYGTERIRREESKKK